LTSSNLVLVSIPQHLNPFLGEKSMIDIPRQSNVTILLNLFESSIVYFEIVSGKISGNKIIIGGSTNISILCI